jgi:hypothetical protein
MCRPAGVLLPAVAVAVAVAADGRVRTGMCYTACVRLAVQVAMARLVLCGLQQLLGAWLCACGLHAVRFQHCWEGLCSKGGMGLKGKAG